MLSNNIIFISNKRFGDSSINKSKVILSNKSYDHCFAPYGVVVSIYEIGHQCRSRIVWGMQSEEMLLPFFPTSFFSISVLLAIRTNIKIINVGKWNKNKKSLLGLKRCCCFDTMTKILKILRLIYSLKDTMVLYTKTIKGKRNNHIYNKRQ